MSALNIAITTMMNEQQKMALAAHNVANSETKDYSKVRAEQVEVHTNNQPQGSAIIGFRTDGDSFLEEQLLAETSKHSYFDTKKFYYDKIDLALGQPGSMDSLDIAVADIFTQFQNLAIKPDNIAQKVIVAKQLENLTNKVSSLANQLEELRFSIDHRVHNVVEDLNTHLWQLFELNRDMVSSPRGSMEYINAENSFKVHLQQTASFFNLKSYQDSEGFINIYTQDGFSLLNNSLIHQLSYQPISNIQTLLEDKSLNPILLKGFTPQGGDTGLNLEMTNRAPSPKIYHSFKEGSIAALLDMRDKEIPKMLAQLDILSKKMSDSFNQVHNQINGFPPASELTGSFMINRAQQLNFNGKFRIGIVDEVGNAVDNAPALTLDFANLDSGNGAGKANLQAALNEINYHFGGKIAYDNRVKIGNLNDIKLVSNSTSIDPSAPLKLDLEIENYSGETGRFQILSATAIDNNNVNILGSVNTNPIYPDTGVTIRTGMSGPSIVINNPAAITYPYTIDVDVMVDLDGKQYFSTITYVIDNPMPDPTNGIINKRFSAMNATGDASLLKSQFNTGLLIASLVDENDIFLPLNSLANGRINFKTTNDKYRIAYDPLDSNDIGNVNANIIASNESFSQYLGLNDLFRRKDPPINWSNLKNSAYYFGVKKDILIDANNLATASYRMVTQNNSDNKPIYKYEVTPSDTNAVNTYLDIINKGYYFPTSGKLPATTLTFQDYAAEIISFNSMQSSFNRVAYEKHKLDMEALQDNLDAIRGVDFNVELMKLDVYHKIYSASAKIVQTLREFDQILFSVIN